MSPKVIVFSCNWDGWSCIEQATSSGRRYPPSVKPVRVSCLARVHAGLILKAFEFGADGVMLLGCPPGDCHFSPDSEPITREYEKARDLLAILGISKDRLCLVQLPAFNGEQFISEVTRFLSEIEKIAPPRRSRGRVTGHV